MKRLIKSATNTFCMPSLPSIAPLAADRLFPEDTDKKNFTYKKYKVKWEDKYDDGDSRWYIYTPDGDEEWDTDTKAEAKQFIDGLVNSSVKAGIYDVPEPNLNPPEDKGEYYNESEYIEIEVDLQVRVSWSGSSSDGYNSIDILYDNLNTFEPGKTWEMDYHNVEIADSDKLDEDFWELVLNNYQYEVDSIPEGIYNMKCNANMKYDVNHIYVDEYNDTSYDEVEIDFDRENSIITGLEFIPSNNMGTWGEAK